MESLELFIYHYGYIAILIGAMVEGEGSLLIGGLAAHAGYLALPWVIVAPAFSCKNVAIIASSESYCGRARKGIRFRG